MYALAFILAAVGVLAYNETNFSVNSTFTAPSDSVYAYIMVWGGGGSGGRVATTGGGGGGGGGFASSFINITPYSNWTVIVGEGGKAVAATPSNGLAGTGSVFNDSTTKINASGGGGGLGTLVTGGAGGTGISGNLHLTNGGTGGVGGTTGGGGGGAGGTYTNGSNGVGNISGAGGLNYGGNGGTRNGAIEPTNGGGGYGRTASNANGANGSIRVIVYNSTDRYGFVYVTVYDESTLNRISVNVNLTISDSNNILPDYTYTINTSNTPFFIENFAAGNYSFKFSGGGYSLRSYQVAVKNNTFSSLNAYLSTSALNTVFTIKDSSNSMGVENAIVTMSKSLGGVFTTVESKFSDVTGSASFNYVASAKYRFTISKTDYSSMVFYLDPILLTGYTIQLVPSSTASLNFDNIGIVFSPTTFYNYQQNNLTFTISSPDGVLSSYGVNVSYPSGWVDDAGINVNGETFNLQFNTSATTSAFDTVNITYYFTSVNTGYHEYNLTYSIRGGVAMGSFLRNQAERFGLGDFEAVLIATIFILLVAGATTYFGGSLIGGVIGLFMMGYFFYIGLLPLWSIILSMLAGFVFISWRSTA